MPRFYEFHTAYGDSSTSLQLTPILLHLSDFSIALFQGHKFAMYFLLPRTLDGIEHLANKVNPFVLTRHVWLMQDLLVNVTIPKFKFDFSSHLEPVLREVTHFLAVPLLLCSFPFIVYFFPFIITSLVSAIYSTIPQR